MRNYRRLLERRSEQERELFKSHKGRQQDLTYHGGYELGYLSGQTNVLEDAVDDVDELQAKYAAVVAELEQAQNEIDRLKLENGALEIAFDSCLKGSDIPKIKADAIREAKRFIIDKWEVTDEHKSVMGDGYYIYISNRALDEHADKVERGES